MSAHIQVLEDQFRGYKQVERHRTMAEALYWIDQYKNFAQTVMLELRAALAQKEAAAPMHDADERADIAKRLRLIVNKLGLTTAVPEPDESLYGCMFSVLGIVRSRIEALILRVNAKEAAAPGDLHAAIMALKWIEPKDINEDAEDDTELSAHRDGWIECRSAAAKLARAALAQPVAVDAPSEDDMSVLKRLAFRTLWLAFRWNDHNFKAAHIEAREACARVGIVTDDQADEWLEHGKLPPIVLRDDPDAKGATTCKWTLDDWESGTWKSSCGELWSFIDGGPQDNRVSYCHHCGSKVAIDAQDGEAT